MNEGTTDQMSAWPSRLVYKPRPPTLIERWHLEVKLYRSLDTLAAAGRPVSEWSLGIRSIPALILPLMTLHAGPVLPEWLPLDCLVLTLDS
ncbi:hypothetical protein RRG08_007509 [Elysia crispata]|uniref:Uncharacterized protein n=1 Tax=Elysia crispata TaxID=231223 RepID=A0AAE0ZEV7_9GAST|nr:hypothetical protein RRG08_007509 [Elysia crispata]